MKKKTSNENFYIMLLKELNSFDNGNGRTAKIVFKPSKHREFHKTKQKIFSS